MTPKAVVFGSDATATMYAFQTSQQRSEMVLATHPEELERLDCSVEVDVVRVTPDVWQPTTYPDEARVKETEKKLKDFTKRGGKTRDVELPTE